MSSPSAWRPRHYEPEVARQKAAEPSKAPRWERLEVVFAISCRCDGLIATDSALSSGVAPICTDVGSRRIRCRRSTSRRRRRRSSTLRQGNEASFDPSHASAARRRASSEPPRGPKIFCANRRIRPCATRNPRGRRQLFFRLGLAAPAAFESARKIPPKDGGASACAIAFKKTPRFIGVSKNEFACAALCRMAKDESAGVSLVLVGYADGTAAQKKLRKTVDTLKKRD